MKNFHKMVTPPPPPVFVKSLFRFFSPIFKSKFFLVNSVSFKGLLPCETVTPTLMKQGPNRDPNLKKGTLWPRYKKLGLGSPFCESFSLNSSFFYLMASLSLRFSLHCTYFYPPVSVNCSLAVTVVVVLFIRLL